MTVVNQTVKAKCTTKWSMVTLLSLPYLANPWALNAGLYYFWQKTNAYFVSNDCSNLWFILGFNCELLSPCNESISSTVGLRSDSIGPISKSIQLSPIKLVQNCLVPESKDPIGSLLIFEIWSKFYFVPLQPITFQVQTLSPLFFVN